MNPSTTPHEQAIGCLERAIAHIRENDRSEDANEIRAAWIEIGGAKSWTRHIHPYPDRAHG